MLWLCLYLPRLPAEALNLRDPLDVITDSRGPQRWLITPGPGDALPAGMALGTALSIQSELRPHLRKPVAERAMLRGLAHLLYRYGSPVAAEMQAVEETGAVPHALLWLEVGGSLRLFGGLRALLAAVQAEMAALDHVMQWAVAPTRRAAALLAIAESGCCFSRQDRMESHLAQQPVATLPWPCNVKESLHGMGLRRIGDLWNLPRGGFARRFGAERLLELDRLRGHAPDPVQAIVPPPRFHRRFDFATEVEGIEALLFPLRRLALELQGWLRARDLGVQSVRLECAHAQKRRHVLELRFLSAHRDGARLFEALRERLNRETLPGAVRSLTLKAEDVARTAAGQASLFGNDDTEQLQWRETVERLIARLGEAALWTPQQHPDHRPERTQAASTLDIATPARHRPSSDASALPPRPLWLLPAPEPLLRRPTVDGDVERIESGWWDGAGIARDYYRSVLSDAEAWVYRDRRNGQWYLHGWWG